MKNAVIATVIALGVAAPAMAQSQLEASVGAAPGQYNLSELAQLADAATKTDNEGRVYFGYAKTHFSASNAHNSVAASIFAQIAEEGRDEH